MIPRGLPRGVFISWGVFIFVGNSVSAGRNINEAINDFNLIRMRIENAINKTPPINIEDIITKKGLVVPSSSIQSNFLGVALSLENADLERAEPLIQIRPFTNRKQPDSEISLRSQSLSNQTPDIREEEIMFHSLNRFWVPRCIEYENYLLLNEIINELTKDIEELSDKIKKLPKGD